MTNNMFGNFDSLIKAGFFGFHTNVERLFLFGYSVVPFDIKLCFRILCFFFACIRRTRDCNILVEINICHIF